MKAGMRLTSTQVEIFLDLNGLIDHGATGYLSKAGALLFPNRTGVEYITIVSLAATGTRFYVRPEQNSV